MNILYICEEYPPGKHGGIGTIVRALAIELVRQGHQVYVVGLYPPGYGKAGYEEDCAVQVWRMRYKCDIGLLKNNDTLADQLIWRALKYSGILHLDTKFSSNKLFRFIKKIVADKKIDIIEMPDWNTFLHNSIGNIEVPSFAVPLVVKFHGCKSYLSTVNGTSVNRRVFNAEKSLINRADALSSVSNYAAIETSRIFNISKKIKVLYNAVSVGAVVNNSPVKYKVIFSGALSRPKGIFSLLAAWNIVQDKIPAAELHVFGKGPVHELKKILNKQSANTVIFHGHVPGIKLKEALLTAAAAIFPSYNECFSLAPLEAMAAGCAVINSSRSSGPELVIDHENGLLVNPDDINAIAGAILLLLKDPGLQKKLARKGFETVLENFNIINSAKAHVEFYENVIRDFSVRS
jgi:glycosyltransferase involved in cell wall biosynthesis